MDRFIGDGMTVPASIEPYLSAGSMFIAEVAFEKRQSEHGKFVHMTARDMTVELGQLHGACQLGKAIRMFKYSSHESQTMR